MHTGADQRSTNQPVPFFGQVHIPLMLCNFLLYTFLSITSFSMLIPRMA